MASTRIIPRLILFPFVPGRRWKAGGCWPCGQGRKAWCCWPCGQGRKAWGCWPCGQGRKAGGCWPRRQAWSTGVFSLACPLISFHLEPSTGSCIWVIVSFLWSKSIAHALTSLHIEFPDTPPLLAGFPWGCWGCWGLGGCCEQHNWRQDICQARRRRWTHWGSWSSGHCR